MADTQRTWAAIQSLLADNANGEISPQDLRDALESFREGDGHLNIPPGSPMAIPVLGGPTYYEANIAPWTLGASAFRFDQSAGNGRLTYTGVADVIAHVDCSVSLTSGKNNQLLHLRVGKNGTPSDESEVQLFKTTGTSVESSALHWSVDLSTGDYISLWARDETADDTITIVCANFGISTRIK